jgi:hypothetical protein
VRAPLAATGLAVVGLAAGCGGSGGLSRAEYAKQADAICAKYNRRIEALARPSGVGGISAFTAKAIPIAQRGNDDLRELRPPKDERATAQEWIDLNDRVVEAIRRLGKAARRGDRAAIRKALREGNTLNGRARRLARRLGLRVCART